MRVEKRQEILKKNVTTGLSTGILMAVSGILSDPNVYQRFNQIIENESILNTLRDHVGSGTFWAMMGISINQNLQNRFRGRNEKKSARILENNNAIINSLMTFTGVTLYEGLGEYIPIESIQNATTGNLEDWLAGICSAGLVYLATRVDKK